MSRAIVVSQPDLDITALLELGRAAADEVHVLSLVEPGQHAAEAAGADGTTALAGEALAAADVASGAIAAAAREQAAEVVILPSTHRFREVTPLLVAALGAACAADTVAVARTAQGLQADRLLYGGVAVATVALQRPIVVLTGLAPQVEARVGDQQPVDVPSEADRRRTLISRTPLTREGDLSSASRVVAFGRGVRGRDEVALIERLASVLGAEVGCSRPIVDDLKWFDLSRQVGLTGTVVRPDLYVAVGISGQIQHVVGMRDSKFIVAINNNPSAPIFDASDVAVIGDLYEIVPKLADALSNR